METPQPSSLAGLSFRFMSFVIFWNHAETTAQQIAQLLLGENPMSMAVVAELGNRTLTEAIAVASHEMGEIGHHLRHFSSGYTTLLSYRNFYVHGIYSSREASEASGKAEATLFMLDGKGRVRYFNRALTEDDLDTAIAGIHALIGYGTAIQKELGATGDGIDDLIRSYGASLERPSWPPPVEKTALYLQGQEPPPPKQPRKGGTR